MIFLPENPVFSPVSGRVWADGFRQGLLHQSRCSADPSDGRLETPCKTPKPQISRFLVYAGPPADVVPGASKASRLGFAASPKNWA